MLNTNSNAHEDPNMSQREPDKEFNQLHPKSLRSSGAELDAVCDYDSNASLQDSHMKILNGGSK